jgi:hypothetical protein
VELVRRSAGSCGKRRHAFRRGHGRKGCVARLWIFQAVRERGAPDDAPLGSYGHSPPNPCSLGTTSPFVVTKQSQSWRAKVDYSILGGTEFGRCAVL